MTTPTDLLQSYFGHESFRGPQLEIIDHVLAKQHALVIMPTGMGKSLCFQIPALAIARTKNDSDNDSDNDNGSDNDPAKRPLTLVLSPLIALMKDQVDALSLIHI